MRQYLLAFVVAAGLFCFVATGPAAASLDGASDDASIDTDTDLADTTDNVTDATEETTESVDDTVDETAADTETAVPDAEQTTENATDAENESGDDDGTDGDATDTETPEATDDATDRAESTPVATESPGSDAELDTVVETYDEVIDELLPLLRSQFADERLAVYVVDDDRTHEFYIETNADGEIVERRAGLTDSPTVQVAMTNETLHDIAESEDSVAAAKRAYENERIAVEGVGFRKRAHIGAVKLSYGFASGIGLV